MENQDLGVGVYLICIFRTFLKRFVKVNGVHSPHALWHQARPFALTSLKTVMAQSDKDWSVHIILHQL
jgi:hypothetical protein